MNKNIFLFILLIAQSSSLLTLSFNFFKHNKTAFINRTLKTIKPAKSFCQPFISNNKNKIGFAFKTGTLITAFAFLYDTSQANNLHENQPKTPLEKFLKKYALPPKLHKLVETNIQNNKDNILWKIKYEKTFGIEDKIYYKGCDINRLINAERMRNYLRKNNLDCLDVAKKYIYIFDGRILVFAETAKPPLLEKLPFFNYLFRSPLSLKEIKQLAKLAQDLQYRDWFFLISEDYKPNWIRDYRKKIVCVDTEDRSFNTTYWDKVGTRIRSNAGHLRRFRAYTNLMTNEAKNWLAKEIATLEAQEKEQAPSLNEKTVVNSPEYDDPEFNFEEIRREINLKNN